MTFQPPLVQGTITNGNLDATFGTFTIYSILELDAFVCTLAYILFQKGKVSLMIFITLFKTLIVSVEFMPIHGDGQTQKNNEHNIVFSLHFYWCDLLKIIFLAASRSETSNL